MERKAAKAIIAYVIALTAFIIGATLTANAAPAQPTHTTVSAPAPKPGDPNYIPTAQDFRDELAHFHMDSTGIQIVVTDDRALNCGSAISAGRTGGGCTWHGGTPNAIMFISPNADDHILLHEFAHARYHATECGAENFANKVEGYAEWSYPSCAKGIEPTR